jgi:exodeoxyribonuclease V beta subunit
VERLDALKAPLAGSLIEASAGTGKTYTITTLFLRLLLERGLSAGEILVVTFTKAATAELRDRIRGRLRDALLAFNDPASRTSAEGDQVLTSLVTSSADRARDRGRVLQALREFDDAAIFTIHGLCERILANHAFESGASFELDFVANEDTLLAEVVSDYWAGALYKAPQSWVRQVVHARLTPEGLKRLAATAVDDPEMTILPEPVAPAELEAALAAFASARKAALAIWRVGRGPILELLKPLSQVKYKWSSVEEWSEAMDRFLIGDDDGSPNLFKQFTKFTTAGLAEGLKKNQAAPSHPFFDACDALLAASESARAAVDDRMLAFKRDLIAYARREVPLRKAALRVQGFDDLLRRLDAALQGPGGPALAAAIRGRYKAALIDEFQDTDPVQYRIFQAIYGGSAAGSMFLIGDPKQAIYSFRGADVFAYLRAARDVSNVEARRFTLDTNYRSDPGLVAAVNAVFSRARDPFLLGDIGFVEVSPAPGATARLTASGAALAPLRFLFATRAGRIEDPSKQIDKGWADRCLPGAVAADIVRLLGSGAAIEGRPLSAGDIAVLVRKNRQAAAVQEALRALRVPSVLQGDASVFDSSEAVEMKHILGAMAEPSYAGAVRLALTTSLFSLSAGEIYALEADDAAWEAWAQRFQRWGHLARERGFVGAFRRLLDEQETPARLLRLVDGERRLTNVLHLAELLHVAATREHLGPTGLLRWLSTVRGSESARERFGAEAAQIRLESDDVAVKLVTIHKSKGLEYPVVYCPYLWDGRLLGKDADEALSFHDPDDDHRRKLDLGGAHREKHRAHAESEAAAENLRLLYVALTRAKHQCSIVWGNFTDAETSALAYLLHQDPEATGDVFEAVKARLRPPSEGKARQKPLDDGAMLADLRALSEATGGAVSVEQLSIDPGARYSPPAGAGASLRCRAVSRSLESRWRTSSFSGLVRAGSAVVPTPTESEGRDRDEAEARRLSEGGSAPPAAKAEEAPVVLHEFPRGAGPGDLIHKVFEQIDFAAPEPDVAACVARQLDRSGLPVATWQEPLTRAVRGVLATPLRAPWAPGDPVFALRDVARDKRLPELEFVFPVAARASRVGGGAGGGAAAAAAGQLMITSRGLGDVFARHAGPPVPGDYADALRRLPFAPLEGFLRGFIDLVFEHGGRFYVIDYKSNFLGPSPSDYVERALVPAMMQHHYILQYHIYVVALHRYLRRRVRNYDYDVHFGGVFYLFVRGMAPEHGVGSGVFADRPSRRLVEELSAYFAGAGAARAEAGR